jgi:selenium metabolism protein YedF
MKIDCCDLACPEPVIRTKNALEELGEDGILDVVVNTTSSIENIKRFVAKQGYTYELKGIDNGKSQFTIVKGYLCEIDTDEPKESFLDKTVFVNSDKSGEGELGLKLMKTFLGTLTEFKELPKNLVFINRGVFLTTQDEHMDLIEKLKILSDRGVQIYSCGLCMNHFGIEPDELKVGEIGNAYDTVDMLLNTKAVTL